MDYEEIFHRDWRVETCRSVSGIRFVRLRREIPEDVSDGEYYANWIGEYKDEFWTPWMIWDIDSQSLESSLLRVRAFLWQLADLGVKDESLRVVFSTSKGFHVYLDTRAIGLTPDKNLHYKLRTFAVTMLAGCDESLYSKRRIIGVPNSVHRKTRLYYVNVPLENLFEWSIEQLKTYAAAPRDFEAWADQVEPVPLLQERYNRCQEEVKVIQESKFWSKATTAEYLSKPHQYFNGVTEGNRNRAMFELARHYKLLGLAMEETILLCRHAGALCSTPLPKTEIEKHVRGVYKK